MTSGWLIFALACCFSTSSVLGLDDNQVKQLYEYFRDNFDCSTFKSLLRYASKNNNLAYAARCACENKEDEFKSTVVKIACTSLTSLESLLCSYPSATLEGSLCNVVKKAQELCNSEGHCRKTEAEASTKFPTLNCESRDCSAYPKPWHTFVCYTYWARYYKWCSCDKYSKLLDCCDHLPTTTTPTTTTPTTTAGPSNPITIEPDIFGTCGATCALKDLADELCAPGSQTGDCTSVPPELIGLYVCCTV